MLEYKARLIDGTDKSIHYYGYNSIEIIGNIYENKELLK